jgi:hypothetical protein
MAFRRTHVLATIQRIDRDLRTSRYIVPSEQALDPLRYGFQFSSKSIRDGLLTGRTWQSRIPSYRKIHPEIKDLIDAQRLLLGIGVAGMAFMFTQLVKAKNEEDRRFLHQAFKQKGFVERYAYRQNPVEFSQRSDYTYT